jgi:hypothetical protein
VWMQRQQWTMVVWRHNRVQVTARGWDCVEQCRRGYCIVVTLVYCGLVVSYEVQFLWEARDSFPFKNPTGIAPLATLIAIP